MMIHYQLRGNEFSYDQVSIHPQEFDYYIQHVTKFVRSFMMSQKERQMREQQQRQAQANAQQAQQTQQAPPQVNETSQQPELNATNLQNLQQQQQRQPILPRHHQANQRRQQQQQNKPPAAPTSEHAPPLPFGSPSGVPVYHEKAQGLTADKLQLPNKKQKKNHPSAASTPAQGTPGSLAGSPQVPKAMPPEVAAAKEQPVDVVKPKEEVKPTIRCPELDCVAGDFESEEELEKHKQDAHKPITDYVQYAIDTLREVLGFDENGNKLPKPGQEAQKKAAAAPAQKPQPAAPAVKQGGTPAIKPEVLTPAATAAVSTPMARVSSALAGIKASPTAHLLKTPQHSSAKVLTPGSAASTAPAKAAAGKDTIATSKLATTPSAAAAADAMAIDSNEEEDPWADMPFRPGPDFDWMVEDLPGCDTRRIVAWLNHEEKEKDKFAAPRETTPETTPESTPDSSKSGGGSDISEGDRLRVWMSRALEPQEMDVDFGVGVGLDALGLDEGGGEGVVSWVDDGDRGKGGMVSFGGLPEMDMFEEWERHLVPGWGQDPFIGSG